MNILSLILSLPNRFAIFLIRIYQRVLSPDTGWLSVFFSGRVCAHTPSCSQYSVQCFQSFSFLRASYMTIERISRCNPAHHIAYDPSRFRIGFASSAAIGIPFLDMIAQDPHCDLVCVISMPDAPSGRGMKIKPNIIADHARTYLSDDHIFTPTKIRPDKSAEGQAFYEKLATYDLDYLVVIAYGKIIPQAILDLPKILPLNVHGSLLPLYRGASPIQQSLLDRQPYTGLTIMKMEASLDTGPIIKTTTIKLTPTMHAGELIDQMKAVGPSLLQDVIHDYSRGLLGLVTQDETTATYTTKIAKEDGVIDAFSVPLEQVLAMYNAYYLWPGIRFVRQDTDYIVAELTIDSKKYESDADARLLPLIMTDGTLNPLVTQLMVKAPNKRAITREETYRQQKK